jgi:FMN reductase
MAHILAVSASPSRRSRTRVALGVATSQLRELGHSVDVLHLRSLPPGPLLLAEFDNPSLALSARRLVAADAVVLATPVFKASYSGLLKVWLDVQSQFALAGKTILPLATGGSLANALAPDDALRPVLASMGAREVVRGHHLIDLHIEAGPSPDHGRIVDERAADGLRRAILGLHQSLAGSSLAGTALAATALAATALAATALAATA